MNMDVLKNRTCNVIPGPIGFHIFGKHETIQSFFKMDFFRGTYSSENMCAEEKSAGGDGEQTPHESTVRKLG